MLWECLLVQHTRAPTNLSIVQADMTAKIEEKYVVEMLKGVPLGE